ncbi:hypothetical protein NMG60_11025138 [Bertholletia excelsa]
MKNLRRMNRSRQSIKSQPSVLQHLTSDTVHFFPVDSLLLYPPVRGACMFSQPFVACRPLPRHRARAALTSSV